MWFEGNMTPTSIISDRVNLSFSLFVTNLGNMFVDNGYYYNQIDKWSINTASNNSIMFVTESCYGVFLDINNTFYCSLRLLHQVVSKSLDDISNALKGVAGTGCSGSTSNMLSTPTGIFIDIDLDLYVADSQNDRIQLFSRGQLNAITIAGNGLSGTITLAYPTGVVLDGDGHLFIVDRGNSRIVGPGSFGFECLIGCSGSGSTPHQLSSPFTMAFDAYGNIFVTDTFNNRIQKFTLKTGLCSKYCNHSNVYFLRVSMTDKA